MKMKNIPRLIFWELTKRCNLNCVHCRAEADDHEFSGEMQLSEIKRVTDDIVSFSNPIMILTGGEPLYREDIFDIAGYMHDKGLRIALATNGTLIDKTIARKIKDIGFERASISIDGKDAASHDNFRGIDGSFERAVKGAQLLKSEGVDFQFNTTITRRNVEEIDEILHLAESTGARALHIFMLVPVGCGVEIADSDMIPKEKYEEVLNWFYDRTMDTKLELKATCAPHYYRIIRQRAREEGRTITFETDGMSAMTRGCLAGSGVCFISHQGDVQPCGYLPIIAGNVLEKSFREIWENSTLFNELRELNNLSGKCGVCEYKRYCAGCRARAYYATGDYLSEEPYCMHIPLKAKK